MDKSSKEEASISDQVQAWNLWNEQTRGNWSGDFIQNATSRRQAEIIESNIAAINRNDLNIIEVGCGSGWLCDRLTRFGQVTGTDLADEVLNRAREKWPKVNFVSGDFLTLDLPLETFDVVVTLEVLSHFKNQQKFITRLAAMLKPGGLLVLATQNRPILNRWSSIGGPTEGQFRSWVNARELHSLLAPDFSSYDVTSIVPVGDQGFLRIVNSTKLNRALQKIIPASVLEKWKERAMLGHTLIARAIK